MLDEFKEYEEYTCSVENITVPRLMPEIFSEVVVAKKTGNRKMKMGGVGRALVTIARKELMNQGYFSAGRSVQEQIIPEVRQALREWLGFNDTSDERVTAYNGWLEKYFEKFIEPLSTDVSWVDIVQSKKSAFEKRWYDEFAEKKDGARGKTQKNKNTLLVMNYDKVIARAVQYGPLKKYYLVCKKGASDPLKKGKRLTTLSTDAQLMNDVYRMISYYLIMQQHTFNKSNKYVYFNGIDFANWAQHLNAQDPRYFSPKIKYVDASDHAIEFIISQTLCKNINKRYICKEYLNAYDFHLVSADDFSGVRDGYTFFSDSGAGRALKQEEKYDCPS